MPHWVLAALDGAKDGSVAYLMVESLADSLLPATFCRFEPLDASFFALEDHRAVLEAALTTHYVALSRGTVISISHLGARHALRVAELEPEEHCSVYRADVSVDVVPPAGSERTAAAALAAAQAPPAATVVLEVPFGDRAGLRVPCPAPGGGATFARVVAPPGAAVQLEVRTETPGPFDFEAYACEARGGAARPTRQDHTHSCVRGDNYRSAILELPAAEADSNLGGPSVWHLGLTGYGAGAVGGECIVVAGPCDDAAAPAPPAESGMARCGNCGAAVPTASLARHEAFCARSNAICLVCDRVVRRQDLESGLHWHCDKCLDPPFVCDSSEARSKHLELQVPSPRFPTCSRLTGAPVAAITPRFAAAAALSSPGFAKRPPTLRTRVRGAPSSAAFAATAWQRVRRRTTPWKLPAATPRMRRCAAARPWRAQTVANTFGGGTSPCTDVCTPWAQPPSAQGGLRVRLGGRLRQPRCQRRRRHRRRRHQCV